MKLNQTDLAVLHGIDVHQLESYDIHENYCFNFIYILFNGDKVVYMLEYHQEIRKRILKDNWKD